MTVFAVYVKKIISTVSQLVVYNAICYIHHYERTPP
jgi:hypothetical protein